MVQIIQSQPTQRQSALEQALGSALQNFGGAYLQGQQTLRQQALADQQMNLKLAEMGVDASAQDLRDYAAGTYKPKVISEGKEAVPAQYKELQGPVQPGKQMGKVETAPAQEAVPAQYGPANPMLNYTQSKKAEMERKKQLESIDLQGKLTDLEAKRFDIENKKELSPYTKRKMMADIDSQMLSMQKMRGDISKQPYELQKIQAETGKLNSETSGTGAVGARLAKMSGETQGKVGAIASGFKALKGMREAIDKGITPSRLDANTPIVGTLFSDNQFTENQRVIDEVIGRLQSGGAIGTEEIKTFRSLGPRPGDDAPTVNRKLMAQESFLKNKLTAFGMKEDDLSQLGFDVGNAQNRGIGAGESQAIMKQVQGMSRAEKIKILQGGV